MTRGIARAGVLASLATLTSAGCESSARQESTRDRQAEIRGACAELASSWCANAALCLPARFVADYGDDATCRSRRAAWCEGAWFGTGSRLEPNELRSCAAKTALAEMGTSARCSEWIRSEAGRNLPERCSSSVGRLPDDSRCLVGVQCQSRSCAPVGQCGFCRAPVQKGGECFEDGDCASGHACVGNRCSSFSSEGGPCGESRCHPDLYCDADEVCRARLAKWSDCDPSAPDPGCELWPGQLACNNLTKKCELYQVAQEGGRCGLRPDGSFALCAHGLACRPGTKKNEGKCEPLVEDRFPCGSSSVDYPLGGPCRAPAACIDGHCQMPSAAGCGPGAPP